MSENFRGVTFAEQSVTPVDDAIVRRAILPDGILTGCGISYSGSTLTMAAGYIIACGRMFQHTTSQNWAVVDATSGYARLVLTIDLTKTATEDSFDQISSAIEYATAVDGFVDLEQSDINASGTRYQIAACVVSLGTGGITGVVSQLELSRAEGGGLNFSVVGGLTQPSDPKENTIWVNTSTAITSWIFSATEPETPVEGMVWIQVGTSSTVEFSATKKNAIMVYPISAKQYINGAWVNKTAQSYQGGEWVDWIVYLYNKGDECTDITGGWSNNGVTINSEDTTRTLVLATKNADHIVVGSTTTATNNRWFSIFADNKIPIRGNMTRLCCEATQVAIDSGKSFGLALYNEKIIGNHIAIAELTCAVGNTETISIDISALDGEYYIGLICWIGQNAKRCANIHRVWIE